MSHIQTTYVFYLFSRLVLYEFFRLASDGRDSLVTYVTHCRTVCYGNQSFLDGPVGFFKPWMG